MKDSMGSTIEIGDWLVYTTGGQSWDWLIGVVEGYTPKRMKFKVVRDIRNPGQGYYIGKTRNVNPMNCMKLTDLETTKKLMIKMELKR